MARNDGVDRTCARNMDVTDNDIGDAQAHNEREKEIYSNEDIIPERSSLNVHFKEPTGSYAEMFEQMKELAVILRAERKKQGSIDFDFPECKLILDDEGHPIDIVPYDRNFATKIIEEFMLAANKAVERRKQEFVSGYFPRRKADIRVPQNVYHPGNGQ